MRRTKYILMAVAMLMVQVAEAQNIAKGFSQLEKGKTAKAKVVFKDAIKAKKDIAVAYYGLALCQCDTLAPKAKPSYADAYKSLAESEKAMKAADEATINMYRQKYGFGAEKVAEKMVEMAERELVRIYKSNSESAFSNYMKTFKAMSNYVEEARRLYEKARWNKAAKGNTIEKYEELKKKPIDSVYIAMADSAIESIRWKNAIEHESLKLYDEYEKLYPNTDKDSLIARARYNIKLKEILKNGTARQCQEFLKKYPDSPDRDTVFYVAGCREISHFWFELSFAKHTVSEIDGRIDATYTVIESILNDYASHPNIPELREQLKDYLYSKGKQYAMKGLLSADWGTYYALFPNGEHSKEVCDYLEKMGKIHYELCDYNEIRAFEAICPKNFPKRPKDWERRMDVALYVDRYYIWGKKGDIKSTIEYCAPYEPAFWAFRELLMDCPGKESALSICRKYLSKLPNHTKAIENTMRTLTKSNKKIEWRAIGDSINTTLSEYSATLSANGRYLYFTRRNESKGAKGHEQIWVSTNIDGKWGVPRYCSTINNAAANFDPETLYPNGNEMVYFDNGMLKLARKSDEGAMEATGEKLPFNIGQWNADVHFTFDGNAALFCTSSGNMVGLHHNPWEDYMGIENANIDIFVCLKDSLGNWGKPISLGKTINTPFIDRSPYLASDMKTLYFASNRHGALSNRTDIFMSKRLNEESWTEWSEPVNVGTHINTTDQEWGLKLSADGSTMYISSKNDIFMAEVPADMRPEPVTLLYGKIENTAGEKVIGYIRWEDLKTGKKLGEMEADMETGEYFVTLPHGKHYAYYIHKDNYVAESGNIYVDKKDKKVRRIRRDVTLATEKEVLTGEVEMRMNNVFFASNSAEIGKMSDYELKRIVIFLQEHDSPMIEVSGHTDNLGGDAANMKMSQKRAEEVKTRLVDLGYDEGKIKAVGYGKTMPKAGNDTEEGRSTNRRVEIKVLK